MIITRTPFRISLFGGGTDYPEWFLKEGGEVITLAINRYCNVIVRFLPPYFNYNYRIRFFNEQKVKDIKNIHNPVVKEILKYLKFHNDKIEIVHQGDLPGLSGLGASSAFTVGALNALSKLKNIELNKKQLAKQAIYIERDLIGDKVGFQDQVITSYGGLNSIKFFKNKEFSVSTIKINNKIKKQIENNLILIYTGNQRFSSNITKVISKQILENKSDSLLSEMAIATKEAKKLFKSSSLDLNVFADLMNYSWERKKKLASVITNNQIEKIYEYGLSNGAYGGKLLGAGGGGFLLFIVPDKNLKRFNKSFKKHMCLKIKIDNNGSKILYC
jgi:D-glycero-alpha-D-manno-heptose-7-phosphate kinase